MPKYFFRCSCEVVELGRHLQNVELEFAFDKPVPSMARLKQKPNDSSIAICTAETSIDVVQETVESFRDTMGELYRNVLTPTVTILRWRCGLSEGPPSPFRNLTGQYSNDGESWHKAPGFSGFKLHLSFSANRQLSSSIGKEIVDLIQSHADEPLGRQLFREAWTLRNTNPRSALVVGVAAAEVGFKKLVGRLLPDAQWLMDEIQTPPLGKMLRNFLPKLQIESRIQGKAICPPNSLLNQLDEAVKCRNKTAHAGRQPPNHDELEAMLRAISDFLWICDVYSGNLWASEHLSADTLKSWHDEVPAAEKVKSQRQTKK